MKLSTNFNAQPILRTTVYNIETTVFNTESNIRKDEVVPTRRNGN